jgi:hypothetical protein
MASDNPFDAEPETCVHQLTCAIGAKDGLVVVQYGPPINQAIAFPPDNALALADRLAGAAMVAKGHKAKAN